MKTIEVYKRGYDFSYGNDWVNVPYITTKDEMIGYIKTCFGQDAFKKYSFVLVRRTR